MNRLHSLPCHSSYFIHFILINDVIISNSLYDMLWYGLIWHGSDGMVHTNFWKNIDFSEKSTLNLARCIFPELTLHDHKTFRGQKELICKTKKLFRTVVEGGLQVGQEVTRRKCTVKLHDNVFHYFLRSFKCYVHK